MKIWCVNTNITFLDSLGADIVLNQNRVVTWYKTDLKQISMGDLILSYNNDKKIIAVGYAISDVQQYSKDEQNRTKEQWIDIDFIWKCKKDLSNSIKTDSVIIEEKNLMYSGTVINWTNGIDLVKLLTEIGKRKIKG